VTTLIGVAIQGRPRIGVIHKPYFDKNEFGEEISKTYMGSIECGLFTSEYNYTYTADYDASHIDRNFNYCQPFSPSPVLNPKTYEPHIAATLNRFSAVEDALNLMKPNLTMRIGGSGNKCLNILDNKAEYLIHTVKSMKYWDVCAVEALVRGRFGVVTDKDKKPIGYCPVEENGKKNFTIPNGLIIARN
jgi:3'-phosphoadenosine 5'-phosphosulfate (PAPS) 3'-phosphatase